MTAQAQQPREPPKPRLAQSYAANVVLVVLTLFPGLINTSAIALLSPVIGGDLRVAPNAAAAIPLMSDAALAFGCVLAAELIRRVESRRLYFVLLAASLASSLVSALTPSFALLLAAHIVHGLVAGMLFVVVLPPLLVNFSSAKLGATASVMVPALFGATTLGPLIGGLVASPQLWRTIFGAEVLIALVAIALAPSVLEKREPRGSDQPVDWFALIASALGSLLIYLGAGALASHGLADPHASAPFAAGIMTYAVLIAVEARLRHPLVPVRELGTSLALIGTIATVAGSAAFSALTQCFTLTLERVDGLGIHATGLAYWPEFLTAIASGYVFGRLVTTRWVVVCGAAGLLFIAAGAGLAHALAPLDAATVGWLCLVSGFGAGLSVSPGLFVVTLASERAIVSRAIALLNLFRLTGGFVSAPGVEHTIGSRATTHLLAIAPSSTGVRLDEQVRAFIVGSGPPPEAIGVARRALALAIDDAYVIVIVVALGGAALIAALMLAAHMRLQAPDLRRFDEGHAALTSPGIA
ncbi:MAG TPA: MFS transporter [Candidatus Elarobacter sp.]|nr:MFS transporter [Candidatus Elarobacter sp.]